MGKAITADCNARLSGDVTNRSGVNRDSLEKYVAVVRDSASIWPQPLPVRMGSMG